eukprot:SAG31_NODE_4548_length_3149_cov_1.504918_3_plen_94_part_00
MVKLNETASPGREDSGNLASFATRRWRNRGNVLVKSSRQWMCLSLRWSLQACPCHESGRFEPVAVFFFACLMTICQSTAQSGRWKIARSNFAR